jgi:hypothetical protein
LVTLAIVAVGAIFLGYQETIDSQAVVALLSACLGYVFGNGHGIAEAKRMVADAQAGKKVSL